MSTPWTAWSETRPALSRSVRAMLQAQLGDLVPMPEAEIGAVDLAPSRLAPAVRTALVSAVGEQAVRDDDESRARHAGGQAFADIVRRRRADTTQSPDVVVLPGDAAQVSAVLRACSENHVAVVPWGGGTSVVGGL